MPLAVPEYAPEDARLLEALHAMMTGTVIASEMVHGLRERGWILIVNTRESPEGTICACATTRCGARELAVWRRRNADVE